MKKDVPKTIGPYKIEDHLHQGSGGAFYRASRRFESTGRSRTFLLYVQDQGDRKDDSGLHRALDSAERNEAISHPNLLPVRETALAGNSFCVASEWPIGGSLASFAAHFLAQGERCPVPAALHVALEAARGLSCLHSFTHPVSGERMGLCHGYLSFDSIFVSSGGHVKLLGPCVAEMELKGLAATAGFRASLPNYLSPEQAANQPADDRSDLFSLGAVLWELLSGGPVFEAKSREEWVAKLNGRALPPSVVNPGVPPEADAIVMKLLEPDLYRRYLLADELAVDLARTLREAYPDFTPLSFAELCRQRFGGAADSATKEITQATRTATAVLKPEPAKAEEEAATQATQGAKPNAIQVVAEVEESRPVWSAEAARNTERVMRLKSQVNSFHLKAAEPNGSALTPANLKLALAIGFCFLLLAPFVGSKLTKKPRAGKAPTLIQEASAERDPAAVGKLATIRIWSSEAEFTAYLNSEPLTVVDERAVVPAREKVQLFFTKPGFDDIYMERTFAVGEVHDIELEFKRVQQ